MTINEGTRVLYRPDGEKLTAGTVLAHPAIDTDGDAHQDLAWVIWDDGISDLEDVDNLFIIN